MNGLGSGLGVGGLPEDRPDCTVLLRNRKVTHDIERYTSRGAQGPSKAPLDHDSTAAPDGETDINKTHPQGARSGTFAYRRVASSRVG